MQVSINLTNYEGTSIFRAFEMVCREAQRFGVSVASSEIVGLVPQKALDGVPNTISGWRISSARRFWRIA